MLESPRPMRFHLPFLIRLRAALGGRDWFGVAIEMLAVILSVVLGLEASQWNARRSEEEYRRQIVAAFDNSLADFEKGGIYAHRKAAAALAAFNSARRAGEQPLPPILHYVSLDRAPTRAWDAIVSSGAARDLEPKILFRLAALNSNADSWSDQYQRYNRFTEEEVLPYLNDSNHFYRDGKLLPIYAAHIDRMRELVNHADEMTREAHALREELRKER